MVPHFLVITTVYSCTVFHGLCSLYEKGANTAPIKTPIGAAIPMYTVRVLVPFLLVLPLFAQQGCATQATEPPKNEGVFLAHVRTTMNEIIDTAKIATCEVISNDCPDLPKYKRYTELSGEYQSDANSGFSPFGNLVTTGADE
jgi:hypothetical protein